VCTASSGCTAASGSCPALSPSSLRGCERQVHVCRACLCTVERARMTDEWTRHALARFGRRTRGVWGEELRWRGRTRTRTRGPAAASCTRACARVCVCVLRAVYTVYTAYMAQSYRTRHTSYVDRPRGMPRPCSCVVFRVCFRSVERTQPPVRGVTVSPHHVRHARGGVSGGSARDEAVPALSLLACSRQGDCWGYQPL